MMNYYFKYILLLYLFLPLTGCKQQYKLTDSKSGNKEINNELSTNDFSETTISPYRVELASKMNEVINTSLIDMEVGTPEGLLGNFVCDLTFIKAKEISDKPVDFCLLNNGGLRTPLPKGEITRGKIFELMPFENEIVIVELSGENMLDLIDYIKTKSLMTNSRKAGVPVSGLRMIINNDKVSEVKIGTFAFDKSKNYRVATSDYLSNGGDHMGFFLDPISIENTGIKLRDAILTHIINLDNKNTELNAILDGRIYHAE
jgi:2',3'-cyclic-nucleotide 2'-phosphodiesterase (5'-nucleotidase family)